MSFADTLLGKLFPKSSPRESSTVTELVSEQLIRTEQEITDYRSWRESDDLPTRLEIIRKAYQLKKAGLDADLNLFIHNSRYGNGFYFTYSPTIGEPTFLYLFDHFRDQTLSGGYRLYTSDLRIREKADKIETIQRHYLKPPLATQPGKIDQKYGNVSIEYVLINDRPSYIKVMANVYSDSHFSEPLDFEDFVDLLLE